MSSSDPSEARLEDEVRRAHDAQALITHPLLAEAFDTVETEFLSAWRDSPARDTEGREVLWHSLKLLAQIRQHLVSVIETGQMAREDLSRRGLSAPR
jgi:FMN-dependent NADH-azoreductase